jgi:4-amino-4-deoxy-L-arabinose transferase-like glycosyltransferase
VRLVYALAIAPDLSGLDDDSFFRDTSLFLADGDGYVSGLDAFTFGEPQPTADHPPLYPLLLSFIARLGFRSVDALRMLGVGAGSLTVLAVGLTANRVAGYRAGVIAAVVCALYPAFVAADGALMSETLFGTLVAFAVLQTLRLLDNPTPLGIALLGLLTALAALTRSEALLLIPLLAVPVVAAAPGRRLQLATIMAAVAVLVISPWVARNWDRFGEPVYSTNDGATIAGANCHQTYYGEKIGGFLFQCVVDVPQPRTPNRAIRARRLREAGFEYAGDHMGRAVVVAGLRFARLWGFYAPGDQIHLTGRDPDVQRVGIWLYYAVLAAGIAGAVGMFRRGHLTQLAVLLVPVLLASATAVATYGLLRLRHIAEISLIVLTGVATDRALK